MWLNSEFLTWNATFESATAGDRRRSDRPHELFSHAQKLLESAQTEFTLSDSILTLKRSINSRLQHLDELYRFSQVFPKSIGALERLEATGLARPLLVRSLFELRNEIEHNDAKPPSHSRCEELLDATWYFLRTTDYPCRSVVYATTFKPTDEGESGHRNLWLTTSVPEFGVRRLELRGWIALDQLSQFEQPGAIPIDIQEIHGRPLEPPNSSDPIALIAYLRNNSRDDDERFIHATANMPLELYCSVYRALFQSL